MAALGTTPIRGDRLRARLALIAQARSLDELLEAERECPVKGMDGHVEIMNAIDKRLHELVVPW